MSANVWTLDGWTGYEGDSFVAGDVVLHIERSTGWHTSAAPRLAGSPRTRGHGSHDAPSFRASRRIDLFGWLFAKSEALLETSMEKLAAICSEEGLHQLQVATASRVRTAMVRLADEPLIVPSGRWNAAVTIPLLAPDPLKYGPAAAPMSTALPTDGGGLSYSLAYPLTYGAAPTTGQIDLVNVGTAPAPVPFAVTGPLPLGFELSTTDGQRILFEGVVPAGQVITIDTATGMVLAEGTADRRAYVTRADWIQVPAGRSTSVQFASLGGYDPAAELAVPNFRSAYW